MLDPGLLEILVCPRCRADLRLVDPAGAAPPGDQAAPVELVCTGADCGLAYPVRDDIPVLLIDEARRPDRSP